MSDSNITALVETGSAAWNAAFNAGNADALAALYTADATLVPPTSSVDEMPP